MSDTQNFENVVLYLAGGFGVSRIHCRNLEVRTGQKYAQYDNAIKLRWTEKGKRKAVGAVLSSRPWCRIVALEGAIKPPDALVRNENGMGLCSKYGSFDERYTTDFEDALAASSATVLLAIGEGERKMCQRCGDRIGTTSEDGRHVCGICASAIRGAATFEERFGQMKFTVEGEN